MYVYMLNNVKKKKKANIIYMDVNDNDKLNSNENMLYVDEEK